LLQAVIDKQARLIAQWMAVGFIHGVMNTDNMALSGETIDYGPCAFMDRFNPQTVYSSIDHRGRYAYGQQPHIAQWNLTRFAETLLSQLDEDEDRAVEIAQTELSEFGERFRSYWLQEMRHKLGLFTEEEGDLALIDGLMSWMQEASADYTNTFRDLTESTGAVLQTPWFQRWQERLQRQPQSPQEVTARMQRANPAVIPRNHQVEEALAAASLNHDYTRLHGLVAAVRDPYRDRAEVDAALCQPAHADFEKNYRTFCGT
jgi:uncharacterized protein YdiU (UPF0061 family)